MVAAVPGEWGLVTAPGGPCVWLSLEPIFLSSWFDSIVDTRSALQCAASAVESPSPSTLSHGEDA